MTAKTKGLEATVNKVLKKYRKDKGMLVSILQDIQAEYNYLPREALKQVCEGLVVPLSQVYSVATFFKAFSLQPRGRHLINVCMGTACHVRGGIRILEKLERELEISSGATTPDLKFTLETVNCVGACALGPIVKVDDDYHGEMTTDKVVSVLKNYS
ncbi:MAG: NADH-quinone oxidoreductase subunit NuoE [Dehalococcoidales bacterium]|nr:NADH-quinone oxidoreductase subunit NuoE [Dehalococcoidales bacterium]MDZ4230864.1 NADH-quinone oxidoreductase subunit NuoE [Dehalococcoidales bacterium]